ncbi:hypothetical protein ACFQ9Z_35070 [Streptomyces sp. NPDC056580]|uniref:hypothetical protein n=1 Tax=Streptomyces sp. NPDC056580 TaxID=3345872 RepID=UPI00367AA0E1
MTPRPRTRVRTQAATALTPVLLTGAITAGLPHPSHLARLLAVLAAVLGAPTATTRTTLALLLRLVPWYAPES